MRHLSRILALVGLVSLSQTLFSQSIPQASDPEMFKKVTFLLNDSTSRIEVVDAKLLFTANTLRIKDGKPTGWSLKDVRALTVDSTTYRVTKLENIADTVKIIEKFIDGKISLYRSPTVTTNEEIFAEKDGIFYELRIVKRYVKESLVYVNEYVSTLKYLMLDCSKIDQDQVETNVGLTIPEVTQIVTKYNNACGWQKVLTARKHLKPLVTIGVLAGAMYSVHNLDYDYVHGKSTVTGIFAGGAINVDFRRYNDTRFRYNFVLEKLGGDGEATYEDRRVDKHEYDILQLRNVFAFDIALYKDENAQFFIGLGTVLQFQLSNSTTVTTSLRLPRPRDYSSGGDAFNLAPLGNLYYEYKRFGVRYELTALAINMTNTEQPGLEHRLSIHYDLKTK